MMNSSSTPPGHANEANTAKTKDRWRPAHRDDPVSGSKCTVLCSVLLRRNGRNKYMTIFILLAPWKRYINIETRTMLGTYNAHDGAWFRFFSLYSPDVSAFRSTGIVYSRGLRPANSINNIEKAKNWPLTRRCWNVQPTLSSLSNGKRTADDAALFYQDNHDQSWKS
jgi:hypothetical protein